MRRERMLSEASLPTMRYDVPIQPRVTQKQAPRFASEPETTTKPADEGREKGAHAAAGASPELVPVRASVFDDDFFRASHSHEEHGGERTEGVLPARFRETTHLSASARVQHEDVRIETEEVSAVETSGRVPSVGGTVMDAAEPDELDIPAFLRRGN